MPEKKRNIKNVLDRLIDDDGLKTEVSITMTSRTLLNLVVGMLVAGSGIVLIASVVKRKQLTEMNRHLIDIKQALKK